MGQGAHELEVFDQLNIVRLKLIEDEQGLLLTLEHEDLAETLLRVFRDVVKL